MTELAGVYRRRRPETTPLFKVVWENLETFLDTYEDRHLERYGFLPDRSVETLRRYLRCGLLQFGFARVRCPQCRREFAVAHSCQLRGVCPSCGQKRVEVWSRFIIGEVIENVPHRQVVLTLPKRFRCFFGRDRKMIGVLCSSASKALTTFFRVGLGRPRATPGIITTVQFFGDRLNHHVHLHIVCTDGAFEDGRFFHLPMGPEDLNALERLFAEEIFAELVRFGKITPAVVEDMRNWRHSGFSADGRVRIARGDLKALARLLRYVARPPIANERVGYEPSTGEVTVLSAKKTAGQRRVVATYNALDFLALLALQVPPKGCHLQRYSAYYSVRSRAKRRGDEDDSRPEGKIQIEKATPAAKERRRRWAQMIRLVYEVDPLRCPCGGLMKIVAFVSAVQKGVVERYLSHLGHDVVPPPPTGPPLWLQIRQAREYHAQNPGLAPEDDVDMPIPDELYVIDEIYPE